MGKAQYQALQDNTILGTVPGFEGVSVQAENLEVCRHELLETLEEWIYLRISRHLPLPVIDGMTILPREFP